MGPGPTMNVKNRLPYLFRVLVEGGGQHQRGRKASSTYVGANIGPVTIRSPPRWEIARRLIGCDGNIGGMD